MQDYPQAMLLSRGCVSIQAAHSETCLKTDTVYRPFARTIFIIHLCQVVLLHGMLLMKPRCAPTVYPPHLNATFILNLIVHRMDCEQPTI